MYPACLHTAGWELRIEPDNQSLSSRFFFSIAGKKPDHTSSCYWILHFRRPWFACNYNPVHRERKKGEKQKSCKVTHAKTLRRSTLPCIPLFPLFLTTVARPAEFRQLQSADTKREREISAFPLTQVISLKSPKKFGRGCLLVIRFKI